MVQFYSAPVAQHASAIDIKNTVFLRSLDESATKQSVVLRLLSLCGWDPFDLSQVAPEYTVGNRRVDFALRPGSADAVFSTIELVETYREAAVRAGREPLVALMRDAWVAETRAEAAAVYGPEVMTAYRYDWRNGLPEFRGIGSEDEITLDNLGPDRLILGEPDECVAEFQRWSEAVGAEYFLLRCVTPTREAHPTRR